MPEIDRLSSDSESIGLEFVDLEKSGDRRLGESLAPLMILIG